MIHQKSILHETFHYENMPIQIYRKFHPQKNWKFSDKKLWYFLDISAQNIDCVHSLELPQQGSSNEYPQFFVQK